MVADVEGDRFRMRYDEGLNEKLLIGHNLK